MDLVKRSDFVTLSFFFKLGNGIQFTNGCVASFFLGRRIIMYWDVHAAVSFVHLECLCSTLVLLYRLHPLANDICFRKLLQEHDSKTVEK